MKFLTSILLIAIVSFQNVIWSQSLHKLQTRNVNQTESVPVIQYDSGNNIIMGLDRTTVLGGTGTTFPSNIWLEKWDQNGNLKWTLSSNITNPQFDSQFIDMAVDAQDNIYLAGLYKAPDFSLGGKTLHGMSNIGIDFFIAKVNQSGNVVWLKGVDTANSHGSRRSLNSISLTPQGDILICGQQMRDFSFGGASFQGDNTVPYINNPHAPVTFYAKMNADGGIIWNRRILNLHSGQYNGRNSLHEMYASEDGSIYATFGADSALIIDNEILISPQPNSAADRAGIIKMNSEGKLLDWKFLESPLLTLSKMRLDNCGKPVLTGYYKGSLTIDSIQITPSARFDIFIAKLDSALNPIWLSSHGSEQGHLGTALAINNRNDIFVAYDFWGKLSYNNTSFTPAAVEVAVVKLDSSGNYMWHNYTEGAGATIQARDLAISPNNKVTMVAHYNGSKSIDNQSVTNGTTIDLMLATFNDSTHPGQAAGCQGIPNMSVNEPIGLEQAEIYPNPANSYIHIDLSALESQIPSVISIYNFQNQLVKENIVTGKETVLDVSYLPSGCYFLKAGENLYKFIKY